MLGKPEKKRTRGQPTAKLMESGILAMGTSLKDVKDWIRDRGLWRKIYVKSM